MKKLIITVLSSFIFFCAFAVDFNENNPIQQNASNYKERFNKYIAAKDTIFAKSVLSDWEEAKPEDPDLFLAYFNYFYLRSMKDSAFISQTKPNNPNVSYYEMRDSTGNVSGYIVSTTVFNKDLIQRSLDFIGRGIVKYPDRLDMRFGRTYVLGRLEQWSEFANDVISIIDYSVINKNAWLWEDGQPLENGENEMIAGVSEYQQQLYSQDSVGSNIRNIASAMLKIYPKAVENINYMAVSYIKDKDYGKALQYLKKAEKIDKNNLVVIRNMAVIYNKMGDEKRSKAYVEKLRNAAKQ